MEEFEDGAGAEDADGGEDGGEDDAEENTDREAAAYAGLVTRSEALGGDDGKAAR